VSLGNIPGNGKSQTGASLGSGTGLVHAARSGEDQRYLLRSDPNARVGDAGYSMTIFRFCGYAYLAARRRIPDRIFDDIQEQLPELRLVDFNVNIARRREVKVLFLFLCQGICVRRQLGQ